jgi:DNA topoisomerase-3
VILVLAEKPSVARDLAAALGARARREGYFEGSGYRVTWAIGHLVGLAQPHEINPSWRTWLQATLPMLPREYPLVVLNDGRAQYRIVERLLRDSQTTSVVAATDAGREGELIFRYIYEHSRCTKPWKRLWVSSLTQPAIRAAFERLEPGTRYDGLAAAAKARSRADWLVGMNLSRAYTLSNGVLFSVGRVQTPTLAMVVARDREIRAFVPEKYLEVEATFKAPNGEFRGTYHARTEGPVRDARGRLQVPKPERARLPADGVLAKQIAERAREGQARIAAVERKQHRTPPPLLYDLTELQRHANRLYGLTAKQTLDAAQALYEKYKALSYPRTDSRHLSTDIAKTLPDIVRAIAPHYEGLCAAGSGERALSRRFVDDSKVSDHHALIPTSEPARIPAGSREAKLYDLVCRRLLMAWHEDKVEAVTTVLSEIRPRDQPAGPADLYVTRGISVESPGWSVLEWKSQSSSRGAGEPVVAAGLAEGDAPEVTAVAIHPKQTQPPKPFTEATLLTAMETAGKTLDDRALFEAMREAGLGTPATRAAILETLIARGYVVRDGKNLGSTAAGEALVDAVHPQVKSAAMTGSWELRLKRMERGEEPFEAFMSGIEAYVSEVVGAVAGTGTHPPPSAARGASQLAPAAATAARPRSLAKPGLPSPASAVKPSAAAETTPAEPSTRAAQTGLLSALLKQRFRFDAFRPHQEAICQAVADGRDALVVMPTGAGKSLCYQLPGVARGGTTLVVSPLIALIEDQCTKLQRNGLRAERIHSGRDRAAARDACHRYLSGDLDFLFIAPERLRVAGFPEMLAKRRPALIAIDEAHCISQWGHDFRPDYRMLRERLAILRPTPIIALTATATPAVQRDIAEQLGVPEATSFILGFRRKNIAIELLPCAKLHRVQTVRELLAKPGTLPAIVYAPTRKATDDVAAALRSLMRVGAYHAGLPTEERERVQAKFLEGKLDCIVATIAFGMGIDKADVRTVVHTGLPSSLEGYYQEIGRAGRDGLPSRAVLLHGPADRRTHEFFLERDYPPERELAALQAKLSHTPVAREALAARVRRKAERVDTMLEKLWVHGGAMVDAEDRVTRGDADWRVGYANQRQHRVDQLERVAEFVKEKKRCRMAALVAHFGDHSDASAACGCCDICAPAETVAVLARGSAAATRATRRRKPRSSSKRGSRRVQLAGAPAALVEAIRRWRLQTAKNLGVPAFRVLTDRQLLALTKAMPTTRAALLGVPGIRERTVQQFGDAMLRLLREARVAQQ